MSKIKIFIIFFGAFVLLIVGTRIFLNYEYKSARQMYEDTFHDRLKSVSFMGGENEVELTASRMKYRFVLESSEDLEYDDIQFNNEAKSGDSVYKVANSNIIFVFKNSAWKHSWRFDRDQ